MDTPSTDAGYCFFRCVSILAVKSVKFQPNLAVILIITEYNRMTERSIALKGRRYMNPLTVFVVVAEKGYHISRACVQIKIQVQSENIRRKLLCCGRFVLWRVVIDQFTGTDRDLSHIVADIFIGIAQINFNIGVLLGQLEDHRKR